MRVPYTVVGGKRAGVAPRLPASLSLVLLNRGGRPFKSSTISDIDALGIREVLSVEGPAASYDIEALSAKYPFIKFLILHQEVTLGEKINMAIAESNGRFNLVLWNDTRSQPGVITERFLDRIIKKDLLCVVPVLQNQKMETLPSIRSPAFYRKQLRVLPSQPSTDGVPSIYPYDFCGIYQKERFTLLGGFDYLLDNPYWQKLDFGFRSFMWGERIACDTTFRLSYLADAPSEDATRDLSYKLFFLKNLAIRYGGDSGHIPRSRFLPYLLSSGADVISAIREFRNVGKWVGINRYRFQYDARSITELWESPE